jgi:hypothetical protein
MEYEKKRIRRRISLRTWPLPKSGAVQCSKLSSLTGDPTGINYLHERPMRMPPMLAFPSLGIMQNDCKLSSCTDIPQLDTHDFELLAALTQWFVAESIALVRHAVVKVVIKPETVMAAVTMTGQHSDLIAKHCPEYSPRANAQVVTLAIYLEVVQPCVQEGLKPHPFRCACSTSARVPRSRWR